jgi:tRNA pseudouridine13 synthase
VLRVINEAELNQLTRNLAAVTTNGVPNYFDSQRFGSLGESGQFIAHPWCLGDYERALWLGLADPNIHDRANEREQKRVLREQWGNWSQLKAQSGRWDADHPAKSIVGFLASQPHDFRRAIALVRQDLRSLWLAAFQSHLWNQILAASRQVCRPEQCDVVDRWPRRAILPQSLDAALRDQLARTVLPLLRSLAPRSLAAKGFVADHVLAAEGIELRQIRVKYPRDSFFSKGDRPAVLLPGDLQQATAADDLYPGRQKLTLWFTLPRGAYATVLVKRIVGASDDITDDDDSESLADAAS